ncbi:RNA polymerase recycling motor ATPase HelR [Pseudolysinimonas sp.]|jgi:DNA helicase IV|uniref:RNA polymerase recycling motor ATPase HelR n=1 Tax=Pseudolysinimonas sp. TaxID=2680009 RepID=UPI003782FED0
MLVTSAFALPDRLVAKSDPALIGDDEQHFARIAATLEQQIADLTSRLEETLRMEAGDGQKALDRDQEVHRLSSRLRTLHRFGLDLCLGRMVPAEGAPVYIGRLGLNGPDGERLLIDWRSPASEPFFGATHADPRGLASRRRYRWTQGRITDYWDEVFTDEGLSHAAALDDQSAFIASLGAGRSSRMRDVLGTIQADQDAIIRAGSRGALVVDGGPGTGKTVVALHRTAYLLYSDARLSRRHGGVLFVGPSAAYLSYVDDVLPSLGEDGVQISTLRDLVPEGVAAGDDTPAAARLKASGDLGRALENAVRGYERPPATGLLVETDWARVEITRDDWADAFESAEPGVSHNQARRQVWDALLEIVHRDLGEEDVRARASLQQSRDLRAAFNRAWPLLDPVGVVADLLSVPSYLRACAPWLSEAKIADLQRADARAWTTADLPLLDAARHRIGDPDEPRRRRQREAALAAASDRMDRVVDQLVASMDLDDGEGLMSILTGTDARESLIDEAELAGDAPDLLAGPFAHIVVDEAQELTDAEWAMLLRRCPSRSFTIVGDRAQARAGFPESWAERLARVGIPNVEVASLTVNYRTPEEVMAEAEPVIRAALPDANVPTSIRSNGVPVHHGTRAELASILSRWEETHDEGVAVVIGDPAFEATTRVRSLTPAGAKGLEFDLVVLVDPEQFGAVDRYVAMTRTTERLVVLS